MAKLLEGRIAVVTGGGRGVGRATAVSMAEHGAAVVVNDYGVMGDGAATERTPAEDVAAEIRAAGGQATPNHDSVATFEGARRIIDTALEAYGRVDLLVMFAGIVRGSTLLETSVEEWDAVIDTHVKGQLACIRYAAESMKRHGDGRILCVTSGQGHVRVQAGMIAYGTAKRGVLGLMHAAALDLAPHGIAVNTFSPLALTRLVTGGESDPDAAAPAPDRELLRNMYPPRAIAPAVTYLMSDAMPKVSGKIFFMNGAELSVMDALRPIETVYKPGRWTPGEIAEAMPRFLGAAMETGRTAGGASPRVPPSR